MTNEFLSKGLKKGRYMKARELIKQFDEEIVVELREIGNKMVNQNLGSFDHPVEGNKSVSNISNTFPYARVDYPMSRVQSRENNTQLKLNVHLYWVDPRDYNRSDVDGVLRSLGYKIKNVSKDDEQRVQRKTRESSVQTAENRFGSKIAFYNHVSSAVEFEETGEKLVEHFSNFVEEYGVSPSETQK